MFADYHVHTAFSDDSTYPMVNVIKDAIRMGMDEICITDHVDYGIKVDRNSGQRIEYRNGDPLANVDYPQYMAALNQMQRHYGDRIKIKIGMEFGVQQHTVLQYEVLFRQYNFDFIILSVHQINDKEFWTQDFQRGKTQKMYNEQYYEELLNLVKKFKNYSVLGHMDLIARYDNAGTYPFEKVKPIITEILKIVIADGKGIELNTSSHRYNLNNSMPCMDILKLYKKLGGEIITIGSDSHKPEHLGTYFKEAESLLSELGFHNFCTYNKMQPTFHNLRDGVVR